jgi:hypothetical protein
MQLSEEAGEFVRQKFELWPLTHLTQSRPVLKESFPKKSREKKPESLQLRLAHQPR